MMEDIVMSNISLHEDTTRVWAYNMQFYLTVKFR